MVSMTGVIFALSSAFFYGTGEFIGGYSSRKISPFQTIVISSIAAIIILAGVGYYRNEPFPQMNFLIFTILSGITGGIGLKFYFTGLAAGNSAVCTSLSGVVGACIPATYSMITEGFPGLRIVSGFVVGLMGIWLVTRKKADNPLCWHKELKPGILAGLGFGFFFLFLGLIKTREVFYLLAFSKLSSAFTGVFFAVISGKPSFVSPLKHPAAVISGCFDAVANGLYLFARQYTRLDVCAVLVSTYPIATILLSRMFYKEEIRKRQWLGIFLSITAVGLISS